MNSLIKVIIPAFNESASIAKVIADIPKDLINEIVVVNNGSTDDTEIHAKNTGATVIKEFRKGYGFACLKGIEHISNQNTKPDIVIFIDADYSDHPEEMRKVVQPIIDGQADLVIGSRALGNREKGSMQPQQVFGNWLATNLLKMFYGVKFTDLGPFRAIRYDKLMELNMQDQTFGWTVEMQLKAAKMKLSCIEIPVSYRKRIGVSKIAGTVKGSVLAGYKILYTIFRYL